MFDNKKRKMERMNSMVNDTLSVRTYNIFMGLCILYGFVANAILVAFAGPIVAEMNYLVFIIGYFISVLIGSIMSAKSSNPIISFIGYNLICVPIGLLLSVCLPGYDMSIIIQAALATAAITAIMIALSQIFPDFFSKLGLTLLISLLAVIVVEFVCMIIGCNVGWIDFIVVGIFSLYIGYDFHKAQMYPKTLDNAIDSAIDLYLDLINIFIRILSILSKNDD